MEIRSFEKTIESSSVVVNSGTADRDRLIFDEEFDLAMRFTLAGWPVCGCGELYDSAEHGVYFLLMRFDVRYDCPRVDMATPLMMRIRHNRHRNITETQFSGKEYLRRGGHIDQISAGETEVI
jgi:hypothetical protein